MIELHLYDKHFCVKSLLIFKRKLKDLNDKLLHICGTSLPSRKIKIKSGEQLIKRTERVLIQALLTLIAKSSDNEAKNFTALIDIYKQSLIFKNPIFVDAEKLAHIKKWVIPTYIPKLIAMAVVEISVEPDSSNQYITVQLEISRIPYGFLNDIKNKMLSYLKITTNKIKIFDHSKGRSAIIRPDLHAKKYEDNENLRDYQNQIIKEIVKVRRGLIVSMTGSGKTVIMVHVIKHFDLPTLILCHRNTLIPQWKTKIKEVIGKTAYTLSGGKITKGDSPILIASLLSLGHFTKEHEKKILSRSKYDPLLGIKVAMLDESAAAVLKSEKLKALKEKGFDWESLSDLLVIVDEAHIAPAFCYYNIISSIQPTILYGCTATPDRGDGRDMYNKALFTERRYKTDINDVLPFLSKMKYITIECDLYFDSNIIPKLSHPDVVMDTEFIKILCSDMFRTTQIIRAIKILAKNNITSLVPCGNNLWFVDALCNALISQNIKCEKVTGEIKDEDRLAIFKATEAKRNHVIVSTTTLDDGIDIPNLGAIVLPIAFSKKLTCIQRVGRVARQAPGKSCAYIIDINDPLIPKAKYAYYQRRSTILNTFNVIRTITLKGDFSSALETLIKEDLLKCGMKT